MDDVYIQLGRKDAESQMRVECAPWNERDLRVDTVSDRVNLLIALSKWVSSTLRCAALAMGPLFIKTNSMCHLSDHEDFICFLGQMLFRKGLALVLWKHAVTCVLHYADADHLDSHLFFFSTFCSTSCLIISGPRQSNLT